MKLSTLAGLLALPALSLAQFPAAPSGLITVISKVDSRVNITFKQTDICETTKGVKSYSGFIHLPADVLPDLGGGYDIHTYFVYFEARHNASTAPLGIYLAGGPGESSIYSAVSSESGPCYINEAGNDTILNPWSFNNNVNILYIDQPVQAGFSYDRLIKGSFDLSNNFVTPEGNAGLPTPNASVGIGLYASQDPLATTNTTVTSAEALWDATQHWLSSFPAYTTSSKKISFWGNSYAGYWVPESAVQFSKALRGLGPKHPLHPRNLTVDSIGITNGCIDFLYSMQAYPEWAYNNTYDIHFITEDVYHQGLTNITQSGGCLDLIRQCRQLGQKSDPKFMGNNVTVNQACTDAFGYCFQTINAFNNRSAFDTAVLMPDPCPYNLAVSNYLNLAEVQQDLGVPLNFTYDSNIVTAVYGVPQGLDIVGTADMFRQAGLGNLEYLLTHGIKVAMVYGDRDYRCPWNGGEATAKAARWGGQQDFLDAGYQEVQGIAPTARGAVVKQNAGLSFSRVFDSGHAVSAYAPQAVYEVFQRTILGVDVATGSQPVTPKYRTTGPTDSFKWRNKMPVDVPRTCMVEGKRALTNAWAAVSGGES